MMRMSEAILKKAPETRSGVWSKMIGTKLPNQSLQVTTPSMWTRIRLTSMVAWKSPLVWNAFKQYIKA